jgi:hypothetical protein
MVRARRSFKRRIGKEAKPGHEVAAATVAADAGTLLEASTTPDSVCRVDQLSPASLTY